MTSARLRGLLVVALGVAAFLGASAPSAAGAHAYRPALLELQAEEEAGRWRVTWKASMRRSEAYPTSTPGEALEPRLPEHCREVGERRSVRRAGPRLEQRLVDCGERGLVGESVAVEGLARIGVDVLLRATGPDGERVTLVLSPERPSAVPFGTQERHGPAGWFGSVFGSYLVIGFEHIVFGFDHLLFVLGLLLLVSGGRKLLVTITSFTLAHSVTLAGATLGLVELPGRAVEASIGLSILLLAVEVAGAESGSEAEGMSAQYPWVVSFLFGLLHGFGFAGALADVGLPEASIPMALFAFNVGVEVGQLAFVGAILLPAHALRWWLGGRAEAVGRRARMVGAYAIGCIAAYWVIARVVAIL